MEKVSFQLTNCFRTFRNHVKKDLDPYICVFDDCDQPYQIFSSSKEWLAHMRSEHRMSWRCVARDHPPQTFETRESFLHHMADAHPGKFRKEQLPYIAESSARALTPTLPACPFCSEDSGDLDNHVAQHLCHFALQSLPWPDHLDQGSEMGSGWELNSSSSDSVERETLKDDLDDTVGSMELDGIKPLDMHPEPELDSPVSWPNIERTFPEPDKVLSDLAAEAARRTAMAQNDQIEKPIILEEELRQVRKLFPGVVWYRVDMDTDVRLLRASLRGPWGLDGKQIVLYVKIDVPLDYPISQTPTFQIDKDEHLPDLVREKLRREVHEICQLCLQRKKTCLAAALSYLTGLRDFASILEFPNVETAHAIPLGDVDEEKPPAAPVSQPDGIELAKAADHNKATTPNEPEVLSKSGYLTKRGKNFGSWKSRFYVLDGTQLKYYDAEGGARLGTINLLGAQIGVQQPQDNRSKDVDRRFDHAFLILEPKKGSSGTRHVLCAETDEELHLWVEVLLKVTEQGKPEDSRSQTVMPRSHIFLTQSLSTQHGKSGQFHPVEHLGLHSIASLSLSSSYFECRLRLSETTFGTLEGRPAGIVYMDISIFTQRNTLQSVDITVTLDDEAPELQQAIQNTIESSVRSFHRPVTLTEFYGPKLLVGTRSEDVKVQDLRSQQAKLKPTIKGALDKVADSKYQAWEFSGRSLPGKNSSLHRTLRWHLSDNLVVPSFRRRDIHTGFVFQSAGQPFCLTCDIEGKPLKLIDRIRQTSSQLGRADPSSMKRGKVIVNMGKERQLRPLDKLAKVLPQEMSRANGLRAPLMNPGERSAHSVDVQVGHGLGENVEPRATSDTSIREVDSQRHDNDDWMHEDSSVGKASIGGRNTRSEEGGTTFPKPEEKSAANEDISTGKFADTVERIFSAENRRPNPPVGLTDEEPITFSQRRRDHQKGEAIPCFWEA